MSAPEQMNLQQALALVKFLTDQLAKRRAGQMVPQSRKEMPSGARMPAMFGGKLAAWVNMPQPTQKTARVQDPKKLLAWAKVNYPDKVQPTVEVETTPELIDHLRDHFPSALKAGEEVDPHWVSDICAALKDPGYYKTNQGEKLFPDSVPGIVLPEAEAPFPTVTLTDDAETIIGEAWRGGGIPMGELLALPAPESTEGGAAA